MKLQKLTIAVATLAVLGSGVACGADNDQPDNDVVVCERTEEFVGNPDCGYYVDGEGEEWVWYATPSPSAEQTQEDEFDIDKPKKKTKAKTRGRR